MFHQAFVNSVRSVIVFNPVRAALRQQEHRLHEEGLRIQQLVEEFKFKQKTIGTPIKTPNYLKNAPHFILRSGLLKDKDASMRELKQLSAQSAKRPMELAGFIVQNLCHVKL